MFSYQYKKIIRKKGLNCRYWKKFYIYLVFVFNVIIHAISSIRDFFQHIRIVVITKSECIHSVISTRWFTWRGCWIYIATCFFFFFFLFFVLFWLLLLLQPLLSTWSCSLQNQKQLICCLLRVTYCLIISIVKL